MLLIGLTVFAVGSVFAAFSDSPIELIGWRAVMGIGGAAVQPTTLAVITNVFPPRERGRAIGVWAGTAGIAVAGGPLAGGAVLRALLVGLGLPRRRPGRRPRDRRRPGVRARVARTPRPGGWTCPASCCRSWRWPAWSTASSTAASGAGWTTPGVLVPIVGGLVALALFVWIAAALDHPALDVSLFRNPASPRRPWPSG